MLNDLPTGRCLEIEVTPEMIEAGEDEVYQHLALEPGCGDARKCAEAVFKVMMNLALPIYAEDWRDRAADCGIVPEAATELLALKAENDGLRLGLEPFKVAADIADECMMRRHLKTDLPDDTTVLGALNLTLGHIRRARAILRGSGQAG